jgi:transcription factor IIIB subunit 2
MGTNCPHCGSSDIDYSDSTTSCRNCGIVLEESQIVSDVTFGENSAGGAVVQGSYVGNEQRGARTQGPGGYRSGGVGASRELTVANARFAIKKMGLAKRVPQSTVERAGRLFLLALEGGTYKADGSEPQNYVLGRKSEYTQASCLYVACRMDKTPHMLIDFADALSVSL